MTTSLARRDDDTPLWVKVGLWQLDTRGTAKAFQYLSTALGVVGVVAGVLVDPIYFGAVGFWLAVPWYHRAIAWRDAHGGWHDDGG
jgi:hypothetical protein